MRVLRMFAGASIDRLHCVAAWRSMDREKAFDSPLVGVAASARDGQHTYPCFPRGICFVEGV
jgi:hypothetical protein